MNVIRSCSFARAFSLLLLLSSFIIAPPAYSGEYHKCTDAKGKVFVSNIACPSTSQKKETYRLNETSEREYQESQRREEEAKQIESVRQQAEAQLERAREKERLLNQCLATADDRYKTRWDDTCLSRMEAKGCSLNSAIGNGYDRSLRGERQECYQRYPRP
jgi:hypothetical protein